jgi:hypothetical protein
MRVAATLAQSDFFMVAPPGREDRIASAEHSVFVEDFFASVLGLGLPLNVSVLDEQAPSSPTLRARSVAAKILRPTVIVEVIRKPSVSWAARSSQNVVSTLWPATPNGRQLGQPRRHRVLPAVERHSVETEDSDRVCGTASAGLPNKLLDYCQ